MSDVAQPLNVASEALGVHGMLRRIRHGSVKRYFDMQARRCPELPWSKVDLEWARLSVDLSESSGYFFSENLVSNESEFLHAASALSSLPPGLAYLGVGPEPMLSYLGLVDTPLAFLIDIRRDNALLHYLYRGVFQCAKSRCEWLSLLTGRHYSPIEDPGADAPIDAILGIIRCAAASEVTFASAHSRIQQALRALPPVLLPFEQHRLRVIHRYFWRYGVELTFQLGGLRLRRYPTLENMLRACASDRKQIGFLASETNYQRIAALERGSRVVPVVGNIAGNALLRAGAELRARGLRVGAVYISNVEQYLFEDNLWNVWVTNLEQLPWHENAILIRSYFENSEGPVPDPPQSLLGQLQRTFAVAKEVRFGKADLPIHQMRTVVHRVPAFLERQRKRSYTGFRELVCDGQIAECEA